jgi:4-amino-4-deoxy-L-arabinose transferase-like glycosyltransferase
MTIEAGAPPAALRLSLLRAPAAQMLAGVLAITALRVLWLALQPADLYPDEAQYWFWAQHPALGYYSKPPLVAWLIALTTGLLGDGEFATRLSAPLLHAGTAVFVYAIGSRLYDSRIGLWSALAYASMPGASISAFIISTDAPLLLFWAAALYAFIKAREDRGWGWWLAVGLASGLGLLTKYAMFYWIFSASGYVLLVRTERRHLRPLLTAIGVALLIYSPNFWWNWGNGFVSYIHVKDNAGLDEALIHPDAFFEFFGSQFAVFGPLFFVGLIALAASPRTLAEPRARLLAFFALPTLTMMLVVSFLSRANANWAAPAFVSATVLVVAWALRRGWRKLVIFSIALHLAGVTILFTGRDALAAFGVELPARYDPLARLRGWRELGTAVGAALAAHPGFTLFADDRETLAALIYYVHPHPFDAVKWKLKGGLAKDQWELSNGLPQHRGENFLLVSEHNLIPEMSPSFAAIDWLQPIVIQVGPGASRSYTLYLARGFTGYSWERH